MFFEFLNADKNNRSVLHIYGNLMETLLRQKVRKITKTIPVNQNFIEKIHLKFFEIGFANSKRFVIHIKSRRNSINGQAV